VAEYDSKPFQAQIVGDKLVLTGEKSRFGYSVRKEFAAVPKKGAIAITYTIVNESDETRQVAPWEISRVPNDGVLFFVAPAEAEIQAYANPGKTFVEIEEQGAYTTLAPGASVSWTVRWSVVKTDLEPAPSKALLKLAKKLAK
jgi:hypothetical protein